MQRYLDANRTRWDALVPVHAASRFYDVEGFLAGRCTLLPYEREALAAEVEGRSMAHLQCHFGLDTLSWARRGAEVTGIDFSGVAIARARELAARAKLPATFVESEVTRASDALDGRTFDYVFTSWGVLGWLPDLRAWARAVAALLRPGGTFYIVETHPTAWLFEGPELERRYGYFYEPEPIREDSPGTYADADAEIGPRVRYSWIYELGHVVSVLLEAGLVIDALEEHDGTCSAIYPTLIRGEDGLFRQPEAALSLPLSFSLRAHLPNRSAPPRSRT